MHQFVPAPPSMWSAWSPPGQVVIALLAGEAVTPVATPRGVGTVACRDLVVTPRTREVVAPPATLERIAPASATEAVVAGATDQDVVPATADQHVVAAEAADDVAVRGSDQAVVMWGPGDGAAWGSGLRGTGCPGARCRRDRCQGLRRHHREQGQCDPSASTRHRCPLLRTFRNCRTCHRPESPDRDAHLVHRITAVRRCHSAAPTYRHQRAWTPGQSADGLVERSTNRRGRPGRRA